MNALSVIEVDPVLHLDKQQLSELLGIPPRAIVRWLREGIPHVGTKHLCMFPRTLAMEWVQRHHPDLYRRRFGAGVL